MWTSFMDMHSGGGQKLQWTNIFIEAPEAEAELVFYHRFHRNPNRVTCTCCGSDYSIYESPTLEQATGNERGCGYDPVQKCYIEEGLDDGYRCYLTLDNYLNRDEVLVIFATDIKPEEMTGTLPREGYIWESGREDA